MIRNMPKCVLKSAIIESVRLMFLCSTKEEWNLFFKSKIQVILLVFWKKKSTKFFDIKKLKKEEEKAWMQYISVW